MYKLLNLLKFNLHIIDKSVKVFNWSGKLSLRSVICVFNLTNSLLHILHVSFLPFCVTTSSISAISKAVPILSKGAVASSSESVVSLSSSSSISSSDSDF
ncbi:hypothetical protein BpHYR1_009693 [Brachionus plicatilis]|uniref:Uncharacterized protein n=1 Tax=Brachionus plicatilis TaxID=10195 RepID=A0A3M7R0H0_BRAPC|nr:hypothetical protein BpHYR1_009693 [Brachionus plicatilis]